MSDENLDTVAVPRETLQAAVDDLRVAGFDSTADMLAGFGVQPTGDANG